MTDDEKLMQQALEALEGIQWPGSPSFVKAAITALRERLAQPEQELVIDCPRCGHCCPRSKPLTHPQIHELDWPDDVSFDDILRFVRAIEAAHGIKEKNNG